ncbi:MAG: hypothetical protein E6R04_02225 [Spirochaetes bacterium]|nr:MAG: hypothetical protein E6R04_02225 [Spirochaetota bacterium]
MEKLKFETINTITHQNWNEFVQKVYGRPYNFQQQDGCKDRGTYSFEVCDGFDPYDFENDTIPEKVNGPEMGVSFRAWIERDPKQEIEDGKESYVLELWWFRNFYPCVDMVIDDLRKRGLLENGNYMIVIDW